MKSFIFTSLAFFSHNSLCTTIFVLYRMELLTTPFVHTAHVHTSLLNTHCLHCFIITFILLSLNLKFVDSIPSLHFMNFVIFSKQPVIRTKSSAHSNSQGCQVINSLDNALISVMKSRILSTDPLYTPTFATLSSLCKPFILTLVFESLYNFITTCTDHSFTSNIFSAYQTTSSGTLPKPFSRSTNIVTNNTCFFVFKNFSWVFLLWILHHLCTYLDRPNYIASTYVHFLCNCMLPDFQPLS